MPRIDYSRLSYQKQRSTRGHSVENSFYLQKSKSTPGRYRAYYEYDTSGAKVAVVGTGDKNGKVAVRKTTT